MQVHNLLHLLEVSVAVWIRVKTHILQQAQDAICVLVGKRQSSFVDDPLVFEFELTVEVHNGLNVRVSGQLFTVRVDERPLGYPKGSVLIRLRGGAVFSLESVIEILVLSALITDADAHIVKQGIQIDEVSVWV
jgi:hypothetical protein